MFDVNAVKDACVLWIRQFFEENGKGCNAVVGISGGKDSSVAAALCVEALGKDRVIGVLMPCGEQHDIVLHFRSLYTSIYLVKGQIQGGTAFEQGRQLSLGLTDIYDGDRLLQAFNDDWQEGSPELLAVFRFGL